MFSVERLSEFDAYVEALDDDSVAPKMKLEGIRDRMKEEQKRIAMIQAEAQMMQQRAQQFIMGDPDEQAEQIAAARAQLDAEAAIEAEEAEYAEQEAELDEETRNAEEQTDKE
jgi:hypothetical protein